MHEHSSCLQLIKAAASFLHIWLAASDPRGKCGYFKGVQIDALFLLLYSKGDVESDSKCNPYA